jgi:hypothetical protein
MLLLAAIATQFVTVAAAVATPAGWPFVLHCPRLTVEAPQSWVLPI